MKDWKSKFKKRQESAGKPPDDVEAAAPMQQKTRIVEVRTPNRPFALDYYDEPIEDGEDEGDKSQYEDKAFLDKAGKTEELIGTIAEKGHLDPQDLRNFATNYGEWRSKKPFKLKDSPVVGSELQNVEKKSVVGVFQEYRASLYCAYAGLASFVVSVIISPFAFSYRDYYTNTYDGGYFDGAMIFAVFSVFTLAFFVAAIVFHLKKTLLTIGTDEVGDAYFAAEKGLRNIDPEQIVSYELFYRERGRYRDNRFPFLNMTICTCTGRKIMLSGQVPDGCDNYSSLMSKPILVAENFQALGGSYVIEQMAILLRKAYNCEEGME